MSSSGYNGNQHLKKIATPIEWTPELLEEYAKCAKDPIYFAERYIKIVSIDKGFIPIELYDYQKEIVQKINDNRRVTVLTARQSGKTTIAVAFILHYILFNQYKTAAILANKGDAAREVLSRIQLAYESLPTWLQQGIVVWNKGSIELENGCKVFSGTTTSSSVRGRSLNLLYIDECITEINKVCVEMCGEHYYYSEIINFINIDERNFINIKGCDMIYTVYKTINKINGKEYIGFHKIKSRESILVNDSNSGSIFKDGYLGSGKILRLALEKYGPENFRQELIFCTNNENEAYEMERQLVNKEYTLRKDTYNLSEGGNICIMYGENNGFFGKKHSKESIEKIQYSRNKTRKERPFSWCKMYNSEGKSFYAYDEIYDYYDICEEDKNSIIIHGMVYYGELSFKSIFLQELALKSFESYLNWISTTDERKEIKSKITSERFKGIKKSEESNVKRGESISNWIKNNPEKHKNRMEKINKNPDKIRKTAEFHRGKKRSSETRKNISESLKGKECKNKGKKLITNLETGEFLFIGAGEELPRGYVYGSNNLLNSGPKGKKAFHNKETGNIKFFYIDADIPPGWEIGRK